MRPALPARVERPRKLQQLMDTEITRTIEDEFFSLADNQVPHGLQQAKGHNYGLLSLSRIETYIEQHGPANAHDGETLFKAFKPLPICES
jgi:hypothetical protein